MSEFFRFIATDLESTVWKVEARAGRKVEAIKQFRARAGCGLKEAKDVVEEYLIDHPYASPASNSKTIAISPSSSLVVTEVTPGSFSLKILTHHGIVREEDLLQAVANVTRRIVEGD